MATKTQITDDAFVALLAEYDLGDFVSSEPITAGAVQTNYLLRTTMGKYVFRYYENRTKESAIFETNLIKYLKDRNFPCPVPFKNKYGRFIGMYHGKPFAIFEFVEGQHIELPTEHQQQQLIKWVAELQNITRGYSPLHKKDRWNYGVPLARTLAHTEAQKLGTANAQAKLEWFEATLDALQLPPSLPKGICHGDFHFSNVLYKDGKFAALLDFDDANYTYLILDLATLINPFVPNFDWDTWQDFAPDACVFDFTQSRKVVAEYRRHRPLSMSEKRHLFDVFKLTVLFDCLWRFERGDVKDFFERRKINYLDALGRDAFYANVFA